MLVGIYGYIAATVAVIALVGGGYWYVTSLQRKVQNLSTENVILSNENNKLGETIKDAEKQQEIIVQVDAIGEAERLAIRNSLNRDLKRIDDKRNEGKDKPVGNLLKEFLNEKEPN
jgi:cell division protein FtsB